MRFKKTLFCASIALAAGAAQAVPTTVNSGSFTATYDVDQFHASWTALSNQGPVAGWTLQPEQYQVTAGVGSLRIQFVEANLPPPQNAASTTLNVASGGDVTGSATLALPLALQAAAGMQFTVSMGLDYSGTSYFPPPANVDPNPLPSTFAGTLSAAAGAQSASLIPFTLTVPPEGKSLTSVVLSAALPEGTSLTSLFGSFSAVQADHRGTSPSIIGTIRYVEIDAVSAVPEPSTALAFGGGLLVLCAVRRPRLSDPHRARGSKPGSD
jgi:hypothetical protein